MMLARVVAAALAAFIFAAPAAAAEFAYREIIEGNPNAKVTVIEYASLTCSHCARFYVDHYPALKKDYIDTGKIKFVFRDMPGDPLGLGAALLARCAPEGAGKDMVGLMFHNQQSWVSAPNPLVPLTGFALSVGMSKADVDACVQNKPIVDKIMALREEAMQQKEVKITPTFFVGDFRVDGVDWPALKKLIDFALP